MLEDQEIPPERMEFQFKNKEGKQGECVRRIIGDIKQERFAGREGVNYPKVLNEK